MSEQTCTTTDGLAVCTPATSSDPGCGCSSANQTKQPNLEPQKPNAVVSAVLLGVACLTSPCCVPLIAPIILGLLAGTPLAFWFTSHMGWMYGGLTLISAISFLLLWRYAFQKSSLVRGSRFSLIAEIQKCLKPLNKLVQNRNSR
jgi:hypothetical protein